MRVIEAYVGEYASGKSENAINRALELLGGSEPVTLVDLDLVEPFYTLRPLKRELEEKGLHVVAWETRETMGLGEAGSILKPEMRWVLQKEGHVILDVGYGVSGSNVFNLLEGIETSELKRYAVINVARPMTANLEDILHYLRGFGHIDGLVNNSHLGDETDLDIIQEGVDIVTEAAEILGVPVVATSVDERFRSEFPQGIDHRGNPVRFLTRFMGRAYW